MQPKRHVLVIDPRLPPSTHLAFTFYMAAYASSAFLSCCLDGATSGAGAWGPTDASLRSDALNLGAGSALCGGVEGRPESCRPSVAQRMRGLSALVGTPASGAWTSGDAAALRIC